jgi:hypothetical protein
MQVSAPIENVSCKGSHSYAKAHAGFSVLAGVANVRMAFVI